MAFIANDGRSYATQAAADAANRRMSATGGAVKATSNPVANVNTAQSQQNMIANTGARNTAGNLTEGQSNQNPLVQQAKANRAAIASGQMNPVQAAQAREQATADALKSSTTINNYTSQDPNQVAAQQAINQKYNLDPMTGFKGQAIDMQPGQTMARDFAREQAMAKKLGGLPETPEETAKMLQATYSPDELQKLGLSNYIQKTLSPASTGGVGISLPSGVPGAGAQTGAGQYLSAQQLNDMGLTADKLKSLVAAGNITQQQADQISKTGLEMDKAQSLLNATPKPTNATIGVLEQALKAKSGVGNQPLGESDLFKQAGLNGYAVLAQNLAQHSREMGQKYQSYADLVGQTSGAMADTWQKALDGYKLAQDSFNQQAELLTKAKEKADDWDKTLQQMKLQNELDVQKQETLYKLQQKYDKDKYQLHKVQNEDGSTSFYSFNPATNEITSLKTNNGEVIAGEGYNNVAANSNPANYPTIGKDEYLLGDKVVSKAVYDTILGVGSVGDWCGVYGSKMSTGHKVGNTWAEKKNNMDVTSKDIALGKYQPKLGDKLLIPLGVKTGKNPWGHVAFVTGYNPETGDIYVTESNKDGRQKDSYVGAKGVVTAGKYNINDLSGGKYGGTDWGLVKGNLKSQFAQKITEAVESFSKQQTAPNNNKGWAKVADAFKEMGIKKFAPFATSVLVGNTSNYGLEDLSNVQGESFSHKVPNENLVQNDVSKMSDQQILKSLADNGQTFDNTKQQKQAISAIRNQGFLPAPNTQKQDEVAFQHENTLRDEFTKNTQNFVKIRDSYNSLENASKNPSAAGDLSLIFSYMKILDPGSTVREGEFANAQNAGGVPTQIQNTWNKLISGERLTSQQRSDFVNQAKKLYDSQKIGYDKQVSQTKKLAESYGLDPNRVVYDFANDSSVKSSMIKKYLADPNITQQNKDAFLQSLAQGGTELQGEAALRKWYGDKYDTAQNDHELYSSMTGGILDADNFASYYNNLK